MTEGDSIVERQIREAAARGAFDDLPGSGQPLPGRGRRDEPGWWLRALLERERSRDRAAQRFEQLERAVGALWMLTSERRVRARLTAINHELSEVNSALPETERQEQFDTDAVVAAWRQMTRARLGRDR